MIGLRFRAAVRAGVTGGAAVALVVALAGRFLAVNIAPWSSFTPAADLMTRVTDWGWTLLLLLPIGIVAGTGVAVVCALVFEYVTRSAGWLTGAFVGLVLGLLGAVAVGLLPWLAWELGYRIMPDAAPLAPRDALWAMGLLAGAGVVLGAVAGASYGRPLHQSIQPTSPRWREIHPTTRRFS